MAETPRRPRPATANQTPDAHVRGFSFALESTVGGLALRALHRPDFEPLTLDWSTAEMRRRIQGGRRQLLARALGLHHRPGLRIVDATGGLGRDGFTLAALGASVALIERHPLMVQLLQDARRRVLEGRDARLRAAAARVQIVEADARAWLARRPAGFDAVHLDPMYPDDGKRALPQKAMQMLADLTGGDADAGELLAAALASGIPRVAVKRPVKAPPLGARRIDLEMRGTQARYDVYLSRKPGLSPD